MLCEHCKQNEATVYLSEVINGQLTEHYLCDDCVRKGEEDKEVQEILFHNFISELMKIALEEGYIKSPNPPTQKRCPQCDLSLEEFLKIGRVGCKTCYTTFNNELKNAFINVHGNIKHIGKMPIMRKQVSNDNNIDNKAVIIEHSKIKGEEIKRLQEALQKAIKQEAYEDAARYRDTIRALEKGGED